MAISSRTSSDALFSSVQCELEKQNKTKKNTKTVPSTSNTLLSHLIGILLPSMKVEYIGTVFKLVFWPILPSAQGSIMFCATEPPAQRLSWKHGNVETWSQLILVSSCSGTSNHLSCFLTAAKNTSWCFEHSHFLQHGSNKLNSLFTDRQQHLLFNLLPFLWNHLFSLAWNCTFFVFWLDMLYLNLLQQFFSSPPLKTW